LPAVLSKVKSVLRENQDTSKKKGVVQEGILGSKTEGAIEIKHPHFENVIPAKK
jgi:hypothetical protein